jgi:hypothetical protein
MRLAVRRRAKEGCGQAVEQKGARYPQAMFKFGVLFGPVLAALLLLSACGDGNPEDSLERFVGAINDADFNDAYRELVPACQEEMSLDEFEGIYGTVLLEAGIGRGGSFGATSIKAEDVEVERSGDREAEITVDWVLYTSIDSPLPFFGTVADERVPLNTVLDVAGTADRPLYVLDISGSGDWRLEDCDPLGLTKFAEEVQDLYDDLEYYYDQMQQ